MLPTFVSQAAMWVHWHILSSTDSLLFFYYFSSLFVCFLLHSIPINRPSRRVNSMASSSRARSSSPFSYRKPPSPFSSTSSTSSSSFMNNRLMPRSCSSSASSYFNSGNGYGSRSMTPGRSRNADSMYRGYGGHTASPVGYPSEELIAEPFDSPPKSGSADSISVTIRFRPLR